MMDGDLVFDTQVCGNWNWEEIRSSELLMHTINLILFGEGFQRAQHRILHRSDFKRQLAVAFVFSIDTTLLAFVR